MVFGSKSNCFKCGAPREAGVGRVPADAIYGGVVAGKYDWVCNVLGCRSVNFARRSVCFTCNVGKDPWRPGWISRTGAGVRGRGSSREQVRPVARAANSDAAAAAAWGAAAACRPNPWTRRRTPRGRQRSSTRPPTTRRPQVYLGTTKPRWSPVDPTAAHQRAPTTRATARGREGPGGVQEKEAEGARAARRHRGRGGRRRRPSRQLEQRDTCTIRIPGTTRMRHPMWTTPTRSELPRRISRVVQVERGDERVRTAAGHAPAAARRGRLAAGAQQPQQSAGKKPRVAATIGSTAKLDTRSPSRSTRSPSLPRLSSRP